MKLQLVRIYAVVVAGLAIAGLAVNGHLLGLMNADIALDLVRVVLATYLVYVGFFAKSEGLINSALVMTGALYLGVAVIGLASPTIAGLLPSGLTGFDAAFHFLFGAIAAYAGVQRGEHIAARS